MARSAHEVRIFIRESHLDTFGHVNNATYFQLLEEARWDMITARGFGLEHVRATQTGPVILEAQIKFQRELTNREHITIVSSLIEYRGKIGQMKQIMVKEDGTSAAEAVFVFGLMDLAKRRLIEPTPEWARAVGLEG
jgi:acyl-CoA thioester hydrolase